MKFQLVVKAEDHQQRAVDVLARRLGLSGSRLRRIRLDGSLSRNGQFCRLIDRVDEGDVLLAADGTPDHPSPLLPGHGLDLLHQDDWLLAVNKPPGLITHPTILHPGGTLTDRLCADTLHPVTRLDRDTSGVVLLARNGHAHHRLLSQQISKIYLGLLHGVFPTSQGSICAPIVRSRDSFITREIRPDGAYARTDWRVLATTDYQGLPCSCVAFRLQTGRTHQIRLHCLYRARPLIGETLYGILQCEDVYPGLHKVAPGLAAEAEALFNPGRIRLNESAGRQMLHAALIQFENPLDNRLRTLTAPLPADFLEVAGKLGFRLPDPAAWPQWLLD